MKTKKPNLSADELLALVEAHRVKFIDLQFTDVGGAVKKCHNPDK